VKNRKNRITWSLALAAAGWWIQFAQAAEDPKVLDQTATVVTVEETCDGDCPFADPHAHGLEDLWDLEPGASFEVNHRLFSSTKLFFDLAWNINSEMQDPDPHLVNKNENPLSSLNFSFEHGTIKISDFLFLFAIHDLANPGGKPPSPHAVIYIPYRTPKQPNVELGDLYRLFVIHIPESDDICRAQQQGVAARLCFALRRLSAKWSSGDYTRQGLTKEAQREARDFLDHLFDGIPMPPKPPGPITVEGDPIKFVYDLIIGIRLHNGIIHGTLGGG
jgi:hypothetical protein